MKKFITFSAVALMFLPLGAMAQTFTGVVTATMCVQNRGVAEASAPSHAACAKSCIQSGSPAALIVAHKTVYKVSNPDKLAPFAGQTVVIEGKLDNGIITVASVKQ